MSIHECNHRECSPGSYHRASWGPDSLVRCTQQIQHETIQATENLWGSFRDSACSDRDRGSRHTRYPV